MRTETAKCNNNKTNTDKHKNNNKTAAKPGNHDHRLLNTVKASN